MIKIERIRKEYEKAINKEKELSERLRQIEKTDPNKFHEIWTVRDQIAYREGKSEGLKFVLYELKS